MDFLEGVSKEFLLSVLGAFGLWMARLEYSAKATAERLASMDLRITDTMNSHRALESSLVAKLAEIAERLARIEERISIKLDLDR